MKSKLIIFSKLTTSLLLLLSVLALVSGGNKTASEDNEVKQEVSPLPLVKDDSLVVDEGPVVIEPDSCEDGSCDPVSSSQNCPPVRRRGLFQRIFRR